MTIKLARERVLRQRSFTDAEAYAILSASINYVPGRERPTTAAAKRWISWLCAFTGARVGEIAQLRKQDIRRENDMWVIHITPEAGTVKTNEARDVVLHSQIVDLGFTEFVMASPAGHMFLTPAANGDVLGPLQGLTNRLRDFARAIVPDPNVMPNHGWRHRFKTIGIDAGIEARVLDAIQGHAPRTEGERYGEVSLNAKAVAIRKIPAIEITTSSQRQST